MASIYELTEEMLRQSRGEGPDGELTDEQLERMIAVEEGFTEKLEAYGRLIVNKRARAEGLRVEAKRLAEASRVADNEVLRIMARVKQCMELLGMSHAESDHFKFTVARNGGKIPVDVNTMDHRNLPEEYRTEKVVIQADLDAIREALLAGQSVPFCSLKDRGTHLRIR